LCEFFVALEDTARSVAILLFRIFSFNLVGPVSFEAVFGLTGLDISRIANDFIISGDFLTIA
jgi:hypothetical protein